MPAREPCRGFESHHHGAIPVYHRMHILENVMTIKLGVVMDPISEITVKKDSSLAMMLAAQAPGWSLAYMQMKDLFLRDGIC